MIKDHDYSNDPVSYHKNSSNNSSSNNNNSQANPVQVKNYINWVNTHLKKRPGVKLVENLQNDMKDGVCLIHLIEVISGHVLDDVNLTPKTLIDYKDNIEKILKFMHDNSIKMHHTTSKEIVDGALKPIMRLILALAAHFKPNNVQHYSSIANSHQHHHNGQIKSSSSISNSQQNQQQMVNSVSFFENSQHQQQQRPLQNHHRNIDSMTHLVQAACVNLADVRRFNNQTNQNFK